MITTETIFWAQIGSIIGFLLTLFALYGLLVRQKDATIELQKENIAYLKDQLADAKAQSPDVLAESLTKRVSWFEDELRRLNQDKIANADQIKEKEAELAAARTKAEELAKQVLHAHELLDDFLCPYCGAPLAEKAYQTTDYGDGEYLAFQCGYEVVDCEVRGECKTMSTGPVS